ncbi:histidine phosphatase family protein [Halapricum hydrolyticum]|uniref:Histidine phosphatase family protein n=1 Tax=Halapricum hydrolyticum TaxID=2979991 RepID=A0AAE3LFR5_9EURY|nr:histidine phosphatase family protein [Halapricum hydrolyticum]MCU4719112.1 histidine phosphatase family protein [Halapricum hydrolyticum]MCU4728116.1 histidine phosphatase family protein [Halapricum hydrolyticum]
MTQVFLTRHGETKYNHRGVEMGQLDIPLSDHGREQARDLATRFQHATIDAIFTSPLQRSRETAKILAEPHGMAVTSGERLKERSCGDMEGEKTERIEKMLVENDRNWSDWEPDGGETRAQAVARARPVLEDICNSNPDSRVVVVAHSGINKGLLASLICEDASFGHRVKQGLTCINELEYQADGTWRVHTMNDTAHL